MSEAKIGEIGRELAKSNSDKSGSDKSDSDKFGADKSGPEQSGERREFLGLLAGATGAVGAAAFAWPLIDSLNPAKDVLALASIEVNIEALEEGQSITVKWRGRPVFIRHRTQEETKQAEETDWQKLRDPQSDQQRVKNSQFIIVVGICTHLGCVPLGQKEVSQRGEYGGWFCPCHGSHYDESGRIRQGPAPLNLAVPPYEFIQDATIRIG